MTEKEIQDFIYASIPDISYSEMWEVRNMFIYEFIPLEEAVAQYKLYLQIKEWDKSKCKRYYKVNMLNGGTKYVYMCEDAVKWFYGSTGYQVCD